MQYAIAHLDPNEDNPSMEENPCINVDFENEEDFTEYVNALRSRSTFQSTVELQPDDRLLSLCTCSYEWSEARYLVVGRLTPIMTGNQ